MNNSLDFNNVKTLTQLTKIIGNLNSEGRLKLWVKVYGQFAEFFLDEHNLLTISTDLLKSQYNKISITQRVESSDGKSYNIIGEKTNKERIKNNGYNDLWLLIEKISVNK